MKKKITYSDEPLGPVKILKDFLPKPQELAFREETVEIKVPISRRSMEFFKKQGKKHRTSAAQLIRALADSYAEKFE